MKRTVRQIDAPDLLIRLFVSLFFIILWLPLVQMNFPFLAEVKSNEKRTLAEKPGIRQMIHPHQYVTAYNRYFNDRYGFRSSLVRLNSFLHLTVFNISTTQDVIIGKHGWLMYNSPTDGVSLKDFYGNANFSEDELKRIKSRIIDIHEELKKSKIHFLLVVAPNKHTIYPEYLPDNIRQAQGRQTRLDQVIHALKYSDVDFIDLRLRLLNEKKHTADPLYYRTDTHWNDLGGFFASEEIMAHLRRIYPGIKLLDRDDFIVGSEENRGTGDLAYFLNVSGLLSDTRIKLTPRNNFSAAPLPVPTDYASRAGSDTVGFQVPNPDLPALVMFHDSFGAMLIPYLSGGFSKSIYIRSQKFDFSVIAQEKPAIVIYEISERYLGWLGEYLGDL